MSEISVQEISHLTELSRLTLNPEEAKLIKNDLPKIVAFVDELSVLNATADDSKSEKVSLSSLRADRPSGCPLTVEQLKHLAPEITEDNQIKVPAVFDI